MPFVVRCEARVTSQGWGRASRGEPANGCLFCPEDPAVRGRLTECLEAILNKAQEPPKSKKVQHSNAKNAVLFEAISLVIHHDRWAGACSASALCTQLGAVVLPPQGAPPSPGQPTWPAAPRATQERSVSVCPAGCVGRGYVWKTCARKACGSRVGRGGGASRSSRCTHLSAVLPQDWALLTGSPTGELSSLAMSEGHRRHEDRVKSDQRPPRPPGCMELVLEHW